MFRTIQVIYIANSAIGTANNLEHRYGKRGRLWILLLLPAQMIAISLVMSLAARARAPIRRLRGLPPHPGAERVAAAWTTLLLENTLVYQRPLSMPRPVSAVFGSLEVGLPDAAALGPLSPRSVPFWRWDLWPPYRRRSCGLLWPMNLAICACTIPLP